MSPTSGYRLRAYRFPRDSDFEGQLAGALERMLLLGGSDLHDALFVTRDEHAGEAMAVDLRTASAGGTLAATARLQARRAAAARRDRRHARSRAAVSTAPSSPRRSRPRSSRAARSSPS